jgi:hypothetical protein
MELFFALADANVKADDPVLIAQSYDGEIA